MTGGGSFRIPTPPTMQNHGNYVASLCEIVRWLGEKAEQAGVNMFTGLPGGLAARAGRRRVVGVRTTPSGLKRDGSPGSGYAPPTDLSARVTVLCEGTRGPLTQAWLRWQQVRLRQPADLRAGRQGAVGDEAAARRGHPHDGLAAADGRVRRQLLLSARAEPGGASAWWSGLDYKDATLDVHVLLQKLKQHPLFRPLLEGGEMVEWGAKTIPEGGYYAIPRRRHGDGALIAGDAAGFVEVASLKGIHYAMQSGMFAARAIFQALKKGDTSAAVARRVRPAGRHERHRLRPARAPEHAPRVQVRLLPGRHQGRPDDGHGRRLPRRAHRDGEGRRGAAPHRRRRSRSCPTAS